MTYEDFDRLFTSRLNGVSLADAVRSRLSGSANDDWHSEQFRLNVADNLTAGRFTLVIAVDRITDELKRIVPYVNTHTVSDVRFLALEIGYVRDGNVEIVWPATYGQESAEAKQPPQRPSWSVEAYFEKLHEYGESVESFVGSIVNFSQETGAVLEGGTGALPTLNARFHVGDGQSTVWSSEFYSKGPSFILNFAYLRDAVPMEDLAKCADILRSIEGVEQRYNKLGADFNARPSVPVDPTLVQPGATEAVIRALTTLLRGAATPSRGPEADR
jgi:hypothetical protein